MATTKKANGLRFGSGPAKKTVKQAAKSAAKRKITYWSFSLYNSYKKCPRKAKLSAVDKIKEPSNIYMERGNNIHKALEQYGKGEITKAVLKKTCAAEDLTISSDLMRSLDRIRAKYKKKTKLAIVGQPIAIEDTWAFTKDWDQTTWNDWLNCWLRIKLDVGEWEEEDDRLIYYPTDWKSGRVNEENNQEYTEQLELYALGALLSYPHADEVRPRLYYVDADTVYPDESEDYLSFTQADVPKLKKLWEKRTRPMLNDTTFAPRPGNYCRYCFYRSGNSAVHGRQLCEY